MSMAYGFYQGVFYPWNSPIYNPGGDVPVPETNGVCFAPIGQPENYHGFLYQTAELMADYILYA